MKLKNTLLLLLLAMGAFAFIWFYERHQQSTRDEAEDGTLVAKFDRDKVQAIDLRSPEGKMELRKDAQGRWQIVAPIEDRADAMTIAQLFTEAESLRYVARIDEDGKSVGKERLKEYGLAETNTRLKLAGPEKTVEIQWGKDAATEGRQYIRLDGSPAVYVVGGPLKATVTKRLDEFRDKRLSDVNAAVVNKVTIQTSAGEIEMRRDESNHWSLLKPLKARGNDARIGDLISRAAGARVESFVGDAANLSAYGLQEPRVTVSLYSEEQEPVRLLLGTNPKDEKEKGRTYAKLSTRQAVVLLPKAIESLIATKPNDLRDRRLTRVEADIVDRVTVEGPDGGKIVLARRGESWVRKAGAKDLPVNAAMASYAAGPFLDQQVAEFVADVATDLPKYGLDRPAVKVTASSYASENTAETTAGEKPIVTVLLGRIEGDRVFAKLDDEPFIVALPVAALDALPTELLAWQPLEIFQTEAAAIVALEVARTGQPTISLVLDLEKKWKLAKGDGAVNQIHVGSLLNTLARLRAARWVGATVPEHGLEKPAIIVSYRTAAGATGRLKVGAATADEMWFASAEALTGTFAMNAPDKSALELALMDKAAPPVVGTAPSTAAAGSALPPPVIPAPVQEAPAEAAKPPTPTEAPAQPAKPPRP